MRNLLFCSILGLGISNAALAGLPVLTDPASPAALGDTVNAELVQGAGTGLTASYYNNGTLAGAPALQRVDATIDFRWGKGSPAASLPADYFSVRWEGLLAAPTTGSYTFAVPSDSGVRLWVNGKKVIDTWNTKGTNGIIGVPVSLAAGEKTSIKLEYYEEEGDATVQLQWIPPGKAQQIVPMAYLYPAGSPTTPDPAGSTPALAAAPKPAAVTSAKAPAATMPAPTPAVSTEAVAVAEPMLVTKSTPAPRPAAPTAAKPTPAPKPVAAAKEPKESKPKSATAPKLVRAPKSAAATPEAEVLAGVFTLKVRTTGTPLEVIEPSHPYTGVNANDPAAPSDPQWKIESVGEGYYRIGVQGSSRVLEVLGSETSNGTPMSLWTYYSGNNQLWRIEPVGDGYYKLIAKHSRKALTSKLPAEGGIQQWRYNGHEDQQWKIEPATVKPPTVVASKMQGVGANNMSVYPNPSNGVVQMNYELRETLPLGWVLYDQRGVVVRVSDYRRQATGPHNQTLDFVALPTGDYNLHLTVGTTTTTQPVVIRHPKSDAGDAEASK